MSCVHVNATASQHSIVPEKDHSTIFLQQDRARFKASSPTNNKRTQRKADMFHTFDGKRLSVGCIVLQHTKFLTLDGCSHAVRCKYMRSVTWILLNGFGHDRVDCDDMTGHAITDENVLYHKRLEARRKLS